jgi:phenylalanyl-tRNA synthetase alpha subunit
MSLINTPVSYGEILDKITILEIKEQNITADDKLKNVRHELSILTNTWNDKVAASAEIDQLKEQLKQVNQSLWNIEDNVRIKESKKEFDDEFIQIARSVYYENDKRAAVKKEVNLLLGSELVEEKSYQDYK